MINILTTSATILLLVPASIQASEKSNLISPSERLDNNASTCGCCNRWSFHSENEGITPYSEALPTIGYIKSEYGNAPNYRSCHTDTLVLSVSTMPVGAAGMKINDHFTPYLANILLKGGMHKHYAALTTDEEKCL